VRQTYAAADLICSAKTHNINVLFFKKRKKNLIQNSRYNLCQSVAESIPVSGRKSGGPCESLASHIVENDLT
jgi:hypothetical protein